MCGKRLKKCGKFGFDFPEQFDFFAAQTSLLCKIRNFEMLLQNLHFIQPTKGLNLKSESSSTLKNESGSNLLVVGNQIKIITVSSAWSER